MRQDAFNKNKPWVLFPLSSAQFFADEKFAALSDSRVPWSALKTQGGLLGTLNCYKARKGFCVDGWKVKGAHIGNKALQSKRSSTSTQSQRERKRARQTRRREKVALRLFQLAHLLWETWLKRRGLKVNYTLCMARRNVANWRNLIIISILLTVINSSSCSLGLAQRTTQRTPVSSNSVPRLIHCPSRLSKLAS